MIVWSQLDRRVLGRMAAALWSRLDRGIQFHDLAWADDLLGDSGRQDLWEALCGSAVVDDSGQIDAVRLAAWLTTIVTAGESEPHLLWTLPPEHPSSGQSGASYLAALLQLIGESKQELLLMSPFIQANGLSHLEDQLYLALARGVKVIIIGHGLDDLASHQSQALERLRREAVRLHARLIAYAAVPEVGLLHAKLAVADQSTVILGSANMTGPGLGSNFEAGVILSRLPAIEVARVFRQLLSTSLVQHIFSTFDRTTEQAK